MCLGGWYARERGFMSSSGTENHGTVSEMRRERERSELKERILSTARDMFVHDGYEAVTLRRIAQAIEYSPAALYQYFKDKQDLVMTIIREDYLDLRDALLECLNLSHPVEQMVELGRRYAQWGVTHPNHYRLMLSPPPAWGSHKQNAWQQENPAIEQDALYLLSVFIERAIEAGLVREEYRDVRLMAATLWAGIHGVVILEITRHDRDQMMKDVMETCFERRFELMVKVFRDAFLKPEYA